MIRVLKLTIFIAHLPLPTFLFFRGKRLNLNKLPYLHTPIIYVICIIIAASLFLKLPQAEGSFNEDIAIDPEAIALANTVTARPPGIAAIHYNPAGLSLMGDGSFISQGVMLPIIKNTVKFTQDPKYQGFNDINGNLEKDPLAGTQGTNSSGILFIPIVNVPLDFLVGPITALSYRDPGSKWTYGFSMYAPFAGGWNCADTDPTRYDVQSVYLQHLIYFGPAVSYRVNKTLSLGASFGAGQTAMGITEDLRSPNVITNLTKALGDATQGGSNPISSLTVPMPFFNGGLGPYETVGSVSIAMRDDFSPSYNLGVLWEPYDWISFGLSYNSAINAHLTGKYDFTYSKQFQNVVAWEGSTAIMATSSLILDLPIEPTAAQIGNVSMDMELPQLVNFGIKLKPIKRLSLLADLHWSNWSTTKEYNLQFDQRIQVLQLAKFFGYAGGDSNLIQAKNLQDTLTWSAGIEYKATDTLELRAGYERRNTSSPDNVFDLTSMPTLDYYGVGLGIRQPKNVSIDLSFGYLVGKQYIPDNGSINLNSTVFGAAGPNNPYPGLNVEDKMAMYIGAVKVTMPLEDFLDQQKQLLLLQKVLIEKLIPALAKHSPAPGSLKAVETGKPVDDSSSMIIDNLRSEGKFYYTEDSE